MPEGPGPQPKARQTGAVVLMVIASVGVIAVGLTAYMLDGLSAVVLAGVFVVVYACIGAFPAIAAIRSRATREGRIQERVVKRMDYDNDPRRRG